MSSETVQIEILSRSFGIAAPPSEKDTLLQAVDLLKQKIAVVQNAGKSLDADKILILTALNVIHDLLKAKPKEDLADGEIQRKMAVMLEVCENALSQAEQ